MIRLGFDIGSNSVGSAWIDHHSGVVTTATSIFPAGVDESDEKRGDPKNVKRRMTRHTRVTLARRAERKRQLRIMLIAAGLLPTDALEFKKLLEDTNPWDLRRKGLNERLTPHEFGRVVLHLAQRRGALGLKMVDPEDPEAEVDDGKVKAAISAVQTKMRERNARTFGELISMVQAERVTAIESQDRRPPDARRGPRLYRDPIRNKAATYEHCADRAMIRDEFAQLWEAQKRFDGSLAEMLTDELRRVIDDDSGDGIWRHKGLLFGQRRTYWDTSTLGRCNLEPTERCAPHADMYASRFLVVETVNNLKIIERGKTERALTIDERRQIKAYLSGPLGLIEKGKYKGQPKRSVSVSDLRNLMGWGRVTKTSHFRFNIESDEDRLINTDWFAREIIHGAVTRGKWDGMSDSPREGLNRAILKNDPEDDKHSMKLKTGVMNWGGLTETQADALVAAWKRRPKLDDKCLNYSRRAVRNLLTAMDRDEPWPDSRRPGESRWLTPIEAAKQIANDDGFRDATTGKPLDEQTRRRYLTGSKGATARDRHYMRKHLLRKNGELIFDPAGNPLAEPPPAPLISNPVVRKAIHQVRRHLIEYMTTFERKPDEVYIELSRQAKMGKKDADAVLFRNRLRNRIRNDIIAALGLDSRSTTQQRAAVDRVILCIQQGGVCPLCGNQGVTTRMTPRLAADGEGCEVAHVLPKGAGGHNGLGNVVLAHIKCNREMGRRTPREFWGATLSGGFDEGFRFVEGIYGSIERPKPFDMKNASGDSLWSCYFAGRPGRFTPTFDELKIAQFKKDIKDIKTMTESQGAATKYATRQVMSYLADALFDGCGLPERLGNRLIYTTDGMWTSRFRREWGLFFDPHKFKAKGLTDDEEHLRKEKNRGDHRHHAIDAAVTALCTRDLQIAWEDREKQADRDGVNTASEEKMEIYRENHPLPLPAPFVTRTQLRDEVRRAVFGDEGGDKPICHRPVKRKLIGALHEETLFGPVVDQSGKLTPSYTAKKNVLALDPNHLRLPRKETTDEAIDRLAARRQRTQTIDQRAARKWAAAVVSAKGYQPAIVDPPPGKSGLVRDMALRKRLRRCMQDADLNPDKFTAGEIKKLVESGKMRQASGVPIKSVVLLRTMTDPVVVSRWAHDHATGDRHKLYDATTGEGDAAAARAYVGGNNHHIEIRAKRDKKGREFWSGEIISSFQAAQRKLGRLRALREGGIPSSRALRKLSAKERAQLTAKIRSIEAAHPVVNRTETENGRFIMSLAEGEMLQMNHKKTGEVGFFVVAKLEKPQTIVVVPQWDARSATERKDAEGKRVPNSAREQFDCVPSDLKALAPPGHAHAVKVRVSPLGTVKPLEND